jgi:hypothetical protein
VINLSWNGRGAILGRLAEVLGRVRDLSPLAGPVGRGLWEANRDRALRGVDPGGNPLAPLARSTLEDRRRRGLPPGPPLVRQGLDSDLIRGCTIEATASDGRVEFRKSWPGVPYMTYHINGTPRMPRRDPLGWGAEIADARAALARYLLAGSSSDDQF